MLEPNSRQLLRDALRPPPGYALDRAITTTFSLDLMALLTIPVSFTFFQLKDHDGPPVVDPLALLEALRRYAGRVTVFCQAGQIHLPRQVQLLLGYLEDSVQQVRAPRGGVFHPKLTVLRYAAEATADDRPPLPPVVYRVLCSSRNLTFDRSWDTLLALNGPLVQTRTNAFARNRPLSRFVAALPALAVYPMAASRTAEVQAVAEELLRVNFDLPDGFDEMAFWPLGVDGVADRAAGDWPVLRHRRTLAMAPFTDEGFVRKFAGKQPLGLISRAESLEELSVGCLGHLWDVWYMSTAADAVPNDPDAGATPADAGAEGTTGMDGGPVELTPSIQLHGLHAKLFVCDDGCDAHVYTGSANATTAAFERNVEFLVQLTGKRKRCGIDGLLGRCEDDAQAGGRDKAIKFADLLVPYRRETEPLAESAEKALERLLDETRYALAGAGINGFVEAVPVEDGAADGRFRVSLARGELDPIKIPEGVTVECHPLTLKPSNAVQITSPVGVNVAAFGPLSFEALTSFYAFRLTARAAHAELSCGFVVNVPLTGAPADRAGRLLLALLRNRAQLLRYLLMLLADDEDDARRLVEALAAANHRVPGTDGENGGLGLPLLEPLLQALDRRPERLDQIARLIDDLRNTAEGQDLVAGDFLGVWEPIYAARKALGRER